MSNSNVTQTKVNSSTDSDAKQSDLKFKYYPFTPEYGKRLRAAKLTGSYYDIWTYLIELESWGDNYIEFDPLTVMFECGVSQATFYRAIAKFQELELFDFQAKSFSIRNLHGASKVRSQKSTSKMRKHSQSCENILKNEKTFSKMRKHSQSCENQSVESFDSKTSEASQIYSDLYRSDQIDDDFLNFDEEVNDSKNLDLENAESSEQNQIDKFEDSQELIQKDELTQENEVIEADKAINETKTPEEAKEPIEGDLFRRAVDAHILQNCPNVRNPTAYLKRISIEDRLNWEKSYREAIAPSSQNASAKTSYQQSHKPRDPVAENPHRLASAIDSAMQCRDIDAAIARLEILREIDADKADELAIKHSLQNY